MTKGLSRRAFMGRVGLLGCSLAASPLVTPVVWASAPWERRLVVIVLRGGMDGLDVVRPVGDPDFAVYRGALLQGGEGPDLTGFYTLHPALGDLMPMWRGGDLAFAHATSTPYRDRRSHFDGQDLLEAGTTQLGTGVRDGWLNRMLQHLPGVQAHTAYAIGTDPMRLLQGDAAVANWAPRADLQLSPQALRLAERVMEDDPAMHASLSEAVTLAGDGALVRQMDAVLDGATGAHVEIARFAGGRLRGDARVAAFSLNGWDTHSNQARNLPRSLRRLAETLLTLQHVMGGDVWGRTAVVAMTEFGRTVAGNGSGGTDHGTGGVAVLAGGAIRGGQVFGDWPGLDEAALYDRRDLMPTRDVRAYAAWMMRGVTGLDRAVLENAVFPGLDIGDDPRVLR